MLWIFFFFFENDKHMWYDQLKWVKSWLSLSTLFWDYSYLSSCFLFCFQPNVFLLSIALNENQFVWAKCLPSKRSRYSHLSVGWHCQGWRWFSKCAILSRRKPKIWNYQVILADGIICRHTILIILSETACCKSIQTVWNRRDYIYTGETCKLRYVRSSCYV